MSNYDSDALFAEMVERTKAMEELAKRIDSYRTIIAALEAELAQKNERIFRLEKLAATRGERIRRMEVGEL